jgi:hypothetical protein
LWAKISSRHRQIGDVIDGMNRSNTALLITAYAADAGKEKEEKLLSVPVGD